MRIYFFVLISLCCLTLQAHALDADSTPELLLKRASQIAKWLPEEPRGLGSPITDRTKWDALAKHPNWKDFIPAAEGISRKPIPHLEDEEYLLFSKNGDRRTYENEYGRLVRNITTLTIAECLENKGRFLDTIQAHLDEFISAKSWVMPAHDGNLETFNDKRQIVALGSSEIAFTLSNVNYLLADKLSPETHRKLNKNIYRRILNPMKKQILEQTRQEWWFKAQMNWNSVCFANTTGAAMAIIEDKQDRALFAAAAEHYTKYFLEGFNADGYCTEGPGYWNYGYGWYAILCKTLTENTNGKLNLFADPQALLPAMFGWNIQLSPGMSPAFADCSIRTQPYDWLLDYTSTMLSERKLYMPSKKVRPSQKLFIALLFYFPEPDDNPNSFEKPNLPIRSCFYDTGVLISRPSNNTCRMAAAMKGGNNNEHHNHNDLGSFVVTVDDKPLLLDPGAEVYTKFTFSKQRYSSDAHNSFGHPVPLIAGTMQQTGSQAKAEVIKTEFTDDTDELILDLKSAYDVESLKTLNRQFVYSRTGQGSFTINDTVKFDTENKYETALITYSKIELQGNNSFIVYDDNTKAAVHVNTESGTPVTITTEPLKADFRAGTPTRIAIKLNSPIEKEKISITIEPVNGTETGN